MQVWLMKYVFMENLQKIIYIKGIQRSLQDICYNLNLAPDYVIHSVNKHQLFCIF